MSRGRKADTPAEIPPLGWLDVAYRVWHAMERDHVGLIAAGVAFYGLLAIFPGIAALMALSGLVVEPAGVARQLELIETVVPQEASRIILDQARSVAGARQTGLGLAFAFSLILSLYSVSRGISSLMEGLNIAYGETEKRGFFALKMLTLVLAFVLVLALIMGLVSALLLPAVFSLILLPPWLEWIFSAMRWGVMALLTVTGLSLVYRFGPSRAEAKWKWITPGAVLACVLWMAASYGFSVYVSNFGSYNKTFGSLAGVVILLMWLWMSAYILLFGAEINGEMEAQTRNDSTTGAPQPMGMRGAVKADIVGRSIAGVD